MTTAPNTLAFPDSSHPIVDAKTGLITTEWYKYVVALDRAVRSLVTTSASALTAAGGALLLGGFVETPFVIPSPTAGATITPKPSDNLKQWVTNAAAFTIAATDEVGDVELLITNGSTAGAVTLFGFTKQLTGDALDNTPGHQFVVFIYGLPNGVSACVVKALQ